MADLKEGKKKMKKLIVILIGISLVLVFFLGADFYESYYAINFPMNLQTYINMSEWVFDDTTVFTASTTAFYLNSAGTGQILAVNYDIADTLAISLNDGTNWLKLPPNMGNVVLAPANYDSIHVKFLGVSGGADTTGIPTIGWTIYDSIH